MHEKIYHTDFYSLYSFPKLKSEAHEALSLIFQQDRILTAIKYDNSKEMIQGEFKRKLKEGKTD